MLKKIFKFIKGYVIIEVIGKNKERFVNMCLHNMLYIFDVVPSDNGLRLKTDRVSFIHMRRLARKSGVRLRIVSKHGMKRYIFRYRYRFGFILAGAAVCIFFLILPQYILCVEIDGGYNVDKTEVIDVLRAHGVYVGAKKSRMDDLSEIKNAVVFGVDGINWAWLYDDGARMRLQIQESIPAPEIKDKTAPTDIIASCDGWVRQADIYRGERHVSIGTTVTAGETLVSGRVAVFAEGNPEKYIYVHSDAKIIADTIRVESGEFTTRETLRIKNGKVKKRISLQLFGRSMNLFRNISCGFDEYDVSETTHDFDIPVVGYSGISFTVHTVEAVNVVQHELEVDEMLARAQEQLEERICRKLGTGAVKENEEITYNAENGVYRVELRMHLRENIGMEIPIGE